MANDIQEFFNNVPPVTRTLLLCTTVMFVGEFLQLINPSILINYWPYVYRKLQLWRPLTACLVSTGDPLKRAFDVFALYTYSRKLEEEKFSGSAANYVFYLWTICSVILSVNVFTGGMVYLSPLTQAMIYTWVQDHVDNIVTFYFLKMKACYLPFLMILVSLLLEGTPGALLTGSGYVAGHMYLFCDTLWPAAHGGRKLIETPQILKQLIPDTPRLSRGYGTAYPTSGRSSSSWTSSTNAFSRFSSGFQGTGRRLGD